MGMVGPSHLLSMLQLIHQGKMAELCWLTFTSWPALSGEREQNSPPPLSSEP